MRFKKLVGSVELPEKASAALYVNVRANERIDVCYEDQLRVTTGVHVTVAKNETAWLKGRNVPYTRVGTGELFVPIYNPNKQNIMIYPGQVLAEILVEKAPVKASKRKPRKARLTSSARLVGYESK